MSAPQEQMAKFMGNRTPESKQHAHVGIMRPNLAAEHVGRFEFTADKIRTIPATSAPVASTR